MAGQATSRTAERPSLIDVHQHFWPAELIEALRSRAESPRIEGWTLLLDGEPPYVVQPAHHDQDARRTLEGNTALAAVSLSSPLGVEELDPAQAEPLLHAWHDGVARLPSPFTAWAAVTRHEPDVPGLKNLLCSGAAGLQIPASWMANPAGLERLSPLLEVCQETDRPILVHPGPSLSAAGGAAVPSWWPALTGYLAQLQAAWWSWQVAGRTLLPALRIGFVAGAGLAPVHHERLQTRGGTTGPVDPGVFVDTSSYGPQAIDALIRALGIDAIVAGSDRPYAELSNFAGAPFHLGRAAAVAITSTNPRRFLFGGQA